MNGIIGNIDLVLSNQLADYCRSENIEGLEVAKTSGMLLTLIIDDVLDLSKIEAGQMEVKADESFSLKGFLDQTTSIASAVIAQRKKKIEFFSYLDSEQDIADQICGDPFRLQQVVNNLISNAVKFTDAGKVELKVKRLNEEMLEISVHDTGKGIPQSHLESIFEPFRQVELSDSRKHGGTGLGLTISNKLVALMGGSFLRVKSSTQLPNRGSHFYFTVPYRKGAAPPEVSQNESPLPIDTKKTLRGRSTRRTVLVAEDDAISRRLVVRMLEKSGYNVLTAENGEEAVHQFKTNDGIDLILMDIRKYFTCMCIDRASGLLVLIH